MNKFNKFNKFNKIFLTKRSNSTLHKYTFVETIDKSNKSYIDHPITQDDINKLILIETGGFNILQQWLAIDEESS